MPQEQEINVGQCEIGTTECQDEGVLMIDPLLYQEFGEEVYKHICSACSHEMLRDY